VTPIPDRKRPKTNASLGVITPVLNGRLQVRGIKESISRSYHIFNTVLPLIARKRLPVSPMSVGRFNTGQRALMNPARPVINSRKVCRDLIRGKYFCRIFDNPVVIALIDFLAFSHLNIGQAD
jgi:hypothetical protein